MIDIQFVLPDGQTRPASGAAGQSLMAMARQSGVPGIVAECGGAMMCATCHVYVDPAWVDKLPAPDADEQAMLDNTMEERLPGSRLSCQIPLSEALDGLVVRLPARQ